VKISVVGEDFSSGDSAGITRKHTGKSYSVVNGLREATTIVVRTIVVDIRISAVPVVPAVIYMYSIINVSIVSIAAVEMISLLT
jgi:hypothetical protein